MVTADDLVIEALTQVGKPYVFGAEASPADPAPKAFDCSELVEWACRRLGVLFPDGSGPQIAWCERAGTTIPRAEAVRTRGALLFRRPSPNAPGHVALSLGDGRTIEAMDTARGVRLGDARRPGFELGARVPGVSYSPPRGDVTPASGATGGRP